MLCRFCFSDKWKGGFDNASPLCSFLFLWIWVHLLSLQSIDKAKARWPFSAHNMCRSLKNSIFWRLKTLGSLEVLMLVNQGRQSHYFNLQMTQFYSAQLDWRIIHSGGTVGGSEEVIQPSASRLLYSVERLPIQYLCFPVGANLRS